MYLWHLQVSRPIHILKPTLDWHLRIDLQQVVFHVFYVVAHDEFEGEGAGGAFGAFDGDGVVEHFWVGLLDHVREVEVVQLEEFYQVRPVGGLVALCVDPMVLGVAWEEQVAALGLFHDSDELLLVVAGGVDEVAQDLDFGPLGRVGIRADLLRRELVKTQDCDSHDITQVLGDFTHTGSLLFARLLLNFRLLHDAGVSRHGLAFLGV